jgi:hypothetical protein
VLGGLFILGLMAVAGSLPHYAAPACGLLFVVTVQGMRHLRLWKWHGRFSGRIMPSGLFLMRGFVILSIAAFAFGCLNLSRSDSEGVWAAMARRAHIHDQLERDGERHLVIVMYPTGHNPREEWDYNRADIDNAKVVWARDLEADGNAELVSHFRERRKWRLQLDGDSTQLIPYDDERGRSVGKWHSKSDAQTPIGLSRR